ncbi:ChbG/HpnK family deacetylase [Rhodoblastus sp.]|uniref:ChbG/HpnK family deacetylase n=1 Tax=Rhodoblastus sp. TaxID=1962975 RepID=UPI00261280B1|nr:ChbG/HpnK family deacetylase [Rhodoblastus sp.]
MRKKGVCRFTPYSIMSAHAFALCADDFALSPAVTRGILEALAAGRLTATSAMTTRKGWPEAAKAFRDIAPQADLGLHFNLTLGGPLGEMPAFAPNGAFPAMNAIVPAAWRRALPRAEIRDELRRQLDAFEEAFGAPPDFVDGHQHVQVLPGIADDLIVELAQRGLAGKTWLRDSADRPKRIFARGRHWGKALTVAGLARGFRAKAKAAGFALNDGFSGFSDFDAKADYAEDFASYLRAPGGKPLIMCHPGHVDEELARLDPVTDSREVELAFLLSGRFLPILDAADAALARLSAM